MKNILLLFLLFIVVSCNDFSTSSEDSASTSQKRKLPANMQYSYECLKEDSSQISDAWNKADNIVNKLATFNIEVSDEDQMRFGDTFLIQALKDKNFIIDTSSAVNDKLQKILNDLVDVRSKPSGIKYKILLVQDTGTINAWTVGGKIFITTAMTKKCKNDDQLYAIIGHEIGHNEKGHIKASIRQLKASNKYFGEWGEAILVMKKFLTGSFNQKNELEADYFGLDLTWKLGYDICSIRSFWDDMARGEERDKFFDFFRTHPHSDTRSRCLVNHIKNNFAVDCN